MRILVCGGRDFDDFATVALWLDRLRHHRGVDLVIHGDARGADRAAGEWAKQRNIPVEVYPADWEKFGKSAGFVRNKKMLVQGKPDLVVAFPGGKGTEMMCDIARAASVNVWRPLKTA